MEQKKKSPLWVRAPSCLYIFPVLFLDFHSSALALHNRSSFIVGCTLAAPRYYSRTSSIIPHRPRPPQPRHPTHSNSLSAAQAFPECCVVLLCALQPATLPIISAAWGFLTDLRLCTLKRTRNGFVSFRRGGGYRSCSMNFLSFLGKQHVYLCVISPHGNTEQHGSIGDIMSAAHQRPAKVC